MDLSFRVLQTAATIALLAYVGAILLGSIFLAYLALAAMAIFMLAFMWTI